MHHSIKYAGTTGGFIPAVPLILLVSVALFLAGCGGDSAPEPVTGPTPIQIGSGFFQVTTKVGINGCNSTEVFDGIYEIVLEGSAFSMGDAWSGEWNPTTLIATGASDPVRVVRDRGCTTSTWTTVTLTFDSADKFFGSIVYHHNASSCPETSCVSSWTITGVRQ